MSSLESEAVTPKGRPAPVFRNTLTQKTQPLVPRVEGLVTMYVCGVTVYDDCHLGHARSQTVFDLLHRLLLRLGYRVRYVRNITDIDDKIIRKAQETDRTIDEITGIYIDSFHRDMRRLGILSPEKEPRATRYLESMIRLIGTLLEKGYAYRRGNDVYFRVRKYGGYGELSHQKIDALQAGARIAADEEKEDPLDFALWKGARPGEPSYPAFFGDGRPGWHIECSAMSLAELGETIDIHGGGMDLMFPHHENERAQSESATGKPFVGLWIHNGFVTLNETKMSKSLGNIFRIRTFFETSPFPEEVTREWLRTFLLSTHYASPVDLTEDNLTHAKNALDSLYLFKERLDACPGEGSEGPMTREFLSALCRDMDTPVAFRVLHEAKNALNPLFGSGQALPEEQLSDARALFETARAVLGILDLPASGWVYGKGEAADREESLNPDEVDRLVLERETARREKNYARADAIRDRLKRAGYLLEDNPGGLPRIRKI
ncbi:MAG: cysteine--tRNA ligase [Nitrospirae bacterium]|nr:cysteine--tRNA ligase [Nitrospirota bacterium]